MNGQTDKPTNLLVNWQITNQLRGTLGHTLRYANFMMKMLNSLVHFRLTRIGSSSPIQQTKLWRWRRRRQWWCWRLRRWDLRRRRWLKGQLRRKRWKRRWRQLKPHQCNAMHHQHPFNGRFTTSPFSFALRNCIIYRTQTSPPKEDSKMIPTKNDNILRTDWSVKQYSWEYVRPKHKNIWRNSHINERIQHWIEYWKMK